MSALAVWEKQAMKEGCVYCGVRITLKDKFRTKAYSNGLQLAWHVDCEKPRPA